MHFYLSPAALSSQEIVFFHLAKQKNVLYDITFGCEWVYSSIPVRYIVIPPPPPPLAAVPITRGRTRGPYPLIDQLMQYSSKSTKWQQQQALATFSMCYDLSIKSLCIHKYRSLDCFVFTITRTMLNTVLLTYCLIIVVQSVPGRAGKSLI